MVKKLIDGFQSFKQNFFGKDSEFYQKLRKRGQRPEIMIISCSDSRVDPANLFGTKPGELFVIRNVANLVPPYQPDDNYHGSSAAIEFGVRDLGIKDIVVLGHAFCGGIDALCSHALGENIKNREFITPWIKIAMPVMKTINKNEKREVIVHQVERESIKNSMNNLRTFPWVSALEKADQLRIHGWWFDMEHGALWTCGNGNQEFSEINISASNENM
jgi:carbonic anhydrase